MCVYLCTYVCVYVYRYVCMFACIFRTHISVQWFVEKVAAQCKVCIVFYDLDSGVMGLNTTRCIGICLRLYKSWDGTVASPKAIQNVCF